MATSRRRGMDRPSLVLTAVLVAAVVLGLAATYLAAPSSALAPASTGGGGSASFATVGAVSVAIVFLIVGGMIFYRLLSDRPARVPAMYGSILAVFLVSIAFLAVVHFVSPGSDFGMAPQNATTTTTSPNETAISPPNNNTTGPLPLAPGIPGWVGYVGLAAALVLILALVVPAMRRREEPKKGTDAAGPVRQSLESALRALSAKDPTDPRQTIIGLYARLLEVVAPYLEEFESATPREIERVCVQRFGVAPSHAGDLTRLFEEARYSTHPFGEEAVQRARAALEAALSDVRVRSCTPGADSGTNAIEWGLAAVVATGAAVSLWAGPNADVAAPAAGLALAATGAWVILALLPRLQRPVAEKFTERYDTLVLLRESFRHGIMGRQAVLATLGGLEAEILGSRRAALSLEDEERLRTAPAGEFRAWVDQRLGELEKAS